MIAYLLAALIAACPSAAAAQTIMTGAHGPDWIAIAMFALIVIATLVITYCSAGKTRSKADFYSAGNAITPVQNGLAIAGDFLSAAAFLGISALVYANGFDGLLYALGFLTGWPIVLFLMSERMRNLGSYTFADAAAFRLDRTPIRLVAATGSLVVVLFYLIAQMIGAGKVIELLFGVNYLFAVASVGVLMILYVTVGGMQATTWVQITKAALLLCGGTLLASPYCGISISASPNCSPQPVRFIQKARRFLRLAACSPNRYRRFRWGSRWCSERQVSHTS